MNAICQRCGAKELSWTVHQAEFHIGSIQHWKVQLCAACATLVEEAVVVALARRSGKEINKP